MITPVRPKRSLGQNFFINKNQAKLIARKVIEPIDIPKEKIRLFEIGPGTGVFTHEFINQGVHEKNILVVEKDDDIARQWPIYFPDSRIINDDILSINLRQTIQKFRPDVVFGALPYNISKRIINKMIHNKYILKNQIPLYFIIQREVAEKYCDRNHKSALSVISGLRTSSRILMNISPESFAPRPKVNSSLIKFTPQKPHEIKHLQEFEHFLSSLFKKRRQKLINALLFYTSEINAPKNKEALQELASVKKYQDKRAAELSTEQFKELFDELITEYACDILSCNKDE